MRYNLFLCGLATLILSVLLSAVPSFALVDVGVDSPPNPSDVYYDERCSYIYGSTFLYNNSYYGSYVATNLEASYYGTFIAKTASSGSSWLMRTYVFVDITGRSDYLWQLYTYSLYQQNQSMSVVPWGEVRTSSYQYKTTITDEGKTYLCVYSNPSIPDNFVVSDVVNYYNDNIQFLNGEFWIDLSTSDMLDYCKNFDHPVIIGEYDSTIPCLVRSDVAFSNVATSDSDVSSASVIGLISPVTNKGILTSDYYVDYQAFFGYTTCKTTGIYEVVDNKFYSATKYNGGLDLSLFNADVLAWTEAFYNPFLSGPSSLKVSCNTISINARLRRKSDGNYGDWYSIGINNLGFNDNSYHVNSDGYAPISQGYSGIVSGANQTITPTADFDELLTSQNSPSTSITANDISLGTSESGGVLQQGGIIDLITSTGATNYDNILSALGDVPNLMSVVFGFFPPYVLGFITTAFVLLVTIGLIKMLI